MASTSTKPPPIPKQHDAKMTVDSPLPPPVAPTDTLCLVATVHRTTAASAIRASESPASPATKIYTLARTFFSLTELCMECDTCIVDTTAKCQNITLTERALAVVDYCTERNNQHCPGQPSDGGSNPRLPLDTAASIATPRVRHCHGRYATNRFYCRSTYPSLRELALPNRLLLITQSM